MAIYTATSEVTELIAAGMTAEQLTEQVHGLTIRQDGTAFVSGRQTSAKLDALVSEHKASAAKSAPRTNRYAADCWKCSHTVAAGAGILSKGGTGWLVEHTDCRAATTDGTGWSRYSSRIQTTCGDRGGQLKGTRCGDCGSWVDSDF